MTAYRDESGRARVVLFAMRCAFSGPVLDALCAAPDIDLEAVVLSGRTPEREPLRDTVHACDTASIDIPDRAYLADPAFRTTMERIAPDAIVVACFPWRLPRWIRDLPPRGCLNLHPSLLPQGRGPEPVFWAFRKNLPETGVTLHLMNEAFDAGPVIARERAAIPHGATIPALELSLARIGAALVLDYLRTPPHRAPLPVLQREEDTWHAPLPGEADLVVTTSWDARHAARFIPAVMPVYGPVPIIILATDQRLLVEAVAGVEMNEVEEAPLTMHGDVARIRFAGGVVSCRIVADRRPLMLHV